MSAEDDLRLAWIAHRDGRLARRDALLTLAVASAGLRGEDWAVRVRAFLVGGRPDHLYAMPASLDEVLADPRVVASIVRLRLSYPPSRVSWLVQGASAARGPFLDRPPSPSLLVDEMLLPPRAARPGPPSAPVPSDEALRALGPTTPADAGLPETAGPLLDFYLKVLLGVAVLCASVLDEARKRDSRAA